MIKLLAPKAGNGALAVVLAAVALSACTTGTQAVPEGIGFREARFQDIAAIRQYRTCRDEAVELDRQARQSASPARYLASARLLEKCEAELGSGAAGLAPEERMRAYALGIQDHFKGGDVVRARANLEAMKAAFPNQDLYYADGSSFVESMELLLGLRDRTALGEFSTVNASGEVKSELRRIRYWTQN